MARERKLVEELRMHPEFSWLADHGQVRIVLAIPMAALQLPR
jgi:hypothetical protein